MSLGLIIPGLGMGAGPVAAADTFASLGPALPGVLIEIDFANNPTSTTRTWTDVTTYVRNFDIQRGRTDALARPSVGTLNLTLQNTDGRFDPTNTTSPYYPNVLPMRRIRIRCQWNSITYNLFHGYVEDWPLSFPDMNKNATVAVQAVDALAVLAQFDLVGKSYGVQTSDARSSAVLKDCGFATSETSLQTGQSQIVASGTFTTGTTAQGHLLDVAASENGLLFVNGGGTWLFHDRHYRLLSKSASSGTIGTGAGMIGYRDIATTYGAADIWNTVIVTANGGTAETATDTASTASYYQRTITWPTGGSYLVSSQGEAFAASSYVLSLYRQPVLRIPEVVTVPAGATANWSTVLSSELSDRLTISHVRPDGGTIAGDKFLEGVTHSVTLDRDWAVTMRLSDAVAQSYWVLGDAKLSLLGQTTNLIY